MNNVILIVLLILICLASIILLPQFMIKIAAKKVVKIFRSKYAVGLDNAKTVEELGLKQEGMLNRMMKPRNYKPQALQALMRANVIIMKEDSKLYLSEEALAQTNLKDY